MSSDTINYHSSSVFQEAVPILPGVAVVLALFYFVNLCCHFRQPFLV